MWILLVLIGVPIMAGVTLLLLKRMPVKSTSIAVKLDVGVAWIAALSILLLVPLDIADSFYSYNNHGRYYPREKNNSVEISADQIAASLPLPPLGVHPNASTALWGANRTTAARDASAGATDAIPLAFVAEAVGDPSGLAHRATQSEKVLSVCWEIVYWYTFAAMMTILPFHQEFADSGAFTRWECTKWSLRQNLLFMACAGSAGIFGVFVLIASHRLTVDSLLGFAIAASNAFGLCLVLLLLGYGLVDLPRKVWRLATEGSDQKEQHMYHAIGMQAERAKKAHKECCRNISIVREVSKYFGTRDPLRKYMDIVEDQVDLELEAELFSRELGSYPEMAGSHAPTCAYDFKLDQEDLEFEYADAHQLGLLRRDVRKAQEGYNMEVSRYVKQLREALAQVYKIIVPKESNRHNDYSLDQEDGMLLHGGYGSPSLDPGASASANAIKAFRKRATFALMRAQANYNKYLAPTVLRISSLCLYFLSACIVLAQLTIYEGLPLWLKKISPLKAIIGLMEPNLMLIQITCLGLIGYILATCWFSMFKMKIFSVYIMVPGHTPSNSMLMNAMLLCRLTAPIAFNFMMIAMPMTQDDAVDVRQTTFYKEFGEKMLDLSSLGNFLGLASLSFTTFAPVIMLPYMLFILFSKTKIVQRMCSVCNFRGRSLRERFEFEDEDGGGYASEDTDQGRLGQRLVEEEYGNFTSGIKLGNALKRSIAESSKSDQRGGLLGRILGTRT